MTNKKTGRILWIRESLSQFDEVIRLIQKEGFYENLFLDSTDDLGSFLSSHSPSLIISSFNHGTKQWRSVLDAARREPVFVPVIFSGHPDKISDAIDAIREGAEDFISQLSDARDFFLKIQGALGRRRLHEQVRELQKEIRFRKSSDFIVGGGIKIQNVLSKIIKISESDIPVLVTGESGTGKELVARAIHYNSRRSGGPFIAINCSAIPETLIENELFGHEKGSFTGAGDKKTGLFEQADGGTLFLDEIGDLPEPVQVKLLTILERGEFRRLGGLHTLKINTRLVSATNKKLEQSIDNGKFREDLFYRLNVFPIKLPPLRERREDIPQIANHFLKKHQDGGKEKISGFSPSAIQKLMFYSWGGNIRELENKVRQTIITATGPIIYREDINLDPNQTGTRLKTFKEAKFQFEKDYICNILRISNGNVSEAARLSGKDRKDFYDVMKKHNIKSGKFRKS